MEFSYIINRSRTDTVSPLLPVFLLDNNRDLFLRPYTTAYYSVQRRRMSPDTLIVKTGAGSKLKAKKLYSYKHLCCTGVL